MAGMSETNQRKEYLAYPSVAESVPSLLCGSKAKVLLCAGSGVAGPDGQGLMVAARDGPGITDSGPVFKKKDRINYIAQ